MVDGITLGMADGMTLGIVDGRVDGAPLFDGNPLGNSVGVSPLG